MLLSSFEVTVIKHPIIYPVRNNAPLLPPGQRPFRANTGFNAPYEPPRWKVEDFLTGFIILEIARLKSSPKVGCLYVWVIREFFRCSSHNDCPFFHYVAVIYYREDRLSILLRY